MKSPVIRKSYIAKVDSASKGQALDDAPEEASVKSKAQQKKVYKARLTYRKEWEEKYPWVYCNDPQEGMFSRSEGLESCN